MIHPCKDCIHAEHYPKGKTGKQYYHFCTKDGCDKKKKYQEYRETKRKYIKGDPIENLEEMLQEEIIFVFGCPRHIEYVKHLQLALIMHLINLGSLCRAIRKEVE